MGFPEMLLGFRTGRFESAVAQNPLLGASRIRPPKCALGTFRSALGAYSAYSAYGAYVEYSRYCGYGGYCDYSV